jgi:hypothetical protein
MTLTYFQVVVLELVLSDYLKHHENEFPAAERLQLVELAAALRQRSLQGDIPGSGRTVLWHDPASPA